MGISGRDSKEASIFFFFFTFLARQKCSATSGKVEMFCNSDDAERAKEKVRD